MNLKNIKLTNTNGTEPRREEANEDKNLEDLINRITEYAILAVADWDEEQASVLKHKINQHIWHSLACNGPGLSVLWPSKEGE